MHAAHTRQTSRVELDCPHCLVLLRVRAVDLMPAWGEGEGNVQLVLVLFNVLAVDKKDGIRKFALLRETGKRGW